MPYSTSKILKTLSLMVMMTMTLLNTSAQSYYTKSKKASDYFQKAQNLIHVDNVKALKYVDKALKLDTEFLNAILLKAELCQELKMDSTAMSSSENHPRIHCQPSGISSGGHHPDASLLPE